MTTSSFLLLRCSSNNAHWISLFFSAQVLLGGGGRVLLAEAAAQLVLGVVVGAPRVESPERIQAQRVVRGRGVPSHRRVEGRAVAQVLVLAAGHVVLAMPVARGVHAVVLVLRRREAVDLRVAEGQAADLELHRAGLLRLRDALGRVVVAPRQGKRCCQRVAAGTGKGERRRRLRDVSRGGVSGEQVAIPGAEHRLTADVDLGAVKLR